jgi:hypothetical protein
MYHYGIAPDPGSLPVKTAGTVPEPGAFCLRTGTQEGRTGPGRAVISGDTFSLRYLSRRTGYPHVNSSLTEESVMDNIAWLFPGPADGRRPRAFIIGVAIPSACHLVTGSTVRFGRRTARR